jgi:hypothetical protein
MSAAIEHAYCYPQPSFLNQNNRRLQLATSPAPHDEGAEPFIDARVLQPRTVALALRLVSDVVRSRHHIPAAMLERILLEADPVLTWGGDMLRVAVGVARAAGRGGRSSRGRSCASMAGAADAGWPGRQGAQGDPCLVSVVSPQVISRTCPESLSFEWLLLLRRIAHTRVPMSATSRQSRIGFCQWVD